jgi:hypothetical protein
MEMSSTVRKGNRLQNLARKALEAEGYTVHVAARTSVKRGPLWFSQSNDVFNAFDIIATRSSGPLPLRFIQVTTANMVSERVKKVEPVPIPLDRGSVEIWAHVGGQRRLDRRYREEKKWLSRNYFQVYFKARSWEPDPEDRIPLSGLEEVAGRRRK